MSEVIIQYRGFKAKPLVREYLFGVREATREPREREYTLTIPNEAFESHRARYQDAPDICSLRLRHELAANAADLPKTHYRITDAELDEYRSTHGPKPGAKPLTPKAGRDL